MTRKTHVHLSDLVGLNRLATDVTAELTDLAEALHKNIAGSPGIRGTPMQERTSTIAGLVYESVREVTRLVGGTTDVILAQLAPCMNRSDAGSLPHANLLEGHVAVGDGRLVIGGIESSSDYADFRRLGL